MLHSGFINILQYLFQTHFCFTRSIVVLRYIHTSGNMAPSAENVYVPTDPGNPLKQYPSTGIEVLIIGGGSSGLYLALECVRQGHKPTIIESKPEEAQPSGMKRILLQH